MEHTFNLDLTAEPTLYNLQVDIPLPEHSIQSIQLDSTPIDFVFETGTSSRPSRSIKDTFVPRRPRNAFIIFRSEMSKDAKGFKSIEKDNRHISHMVSHLWNNLPEDQKAVYYRMAKEEKATHKRLYPNYRFAPKPRDKPVVRRNVKRATKAHLERSEKIAKMYADGLSGDALKQAIKELDEVCPIVEEEEVQEQKSKGAARRKKTTTTRRVRSRAQTSSSDASESSRSDVFAPLSPLGSPSRAFRSPLLPPPRFPSEDSDSSSAYSPASSNSDQRGQTQEQISFSSLPVLTHYQTVQPQEPPPFLSASSFVQHQDSPDQGRVVTSFTLSNQEYAVYSQPGTSALARVNNESNIQSINAHPIYNEALQSDFHDRFAIHASGQHDIYLHAQEQFYTDSHIASPLHTSQLSSIREGQFPSNGPVNMSTQLMSAPAHMPMATSFPMQNQNHDQSCGQMYSTPQQNQVYGFDQHLEAAGYHSQSSILFSSTQPLVPVEIRYTNDVSTVDVNTVTIETDSVPFSNVLGSLQQYGHEYASPEHHREPVEGVHELSGEVPVCVSVLANSENSETMMAEGEDWSQFFNLDASVCF